MAFSNIIEEHAADAEGTEYGVEHSAQLDGGGSLRTAAKAEEAEYVRVCDRRERELMYWHADEFGEDFPTVMGAALALACDVIRDNGRNVLRSPDNGDEILIPLCGGGSIRCVAYPAAVEYVRVCDDEGRESGCWTEAEFHNDFAAAITALISAAAIATGTPSAQTDAAA
jgi:hypothetical protein